MRVCVKSFRKKNKEFKTALMISFTLLLTRRGGDQTQIAETVICSVTSTTPW